MLGALRTYLADQIDVFAYDSGGDNSVEIQVKNLDEDTLTFSWQPLETP